MGSSILNILGAKSKG